MSLLTLDPESPRGNAFVVVVVGGGGESMKI
jgi:hypothetical protein